jgi:type VI secretion system protein ImpC
VIGNYIFEQTPPHAELLGRLAKIVAQTQTAFIAGMGTSCIDTKPADLHPLVRQAWDGLAQMPEAAYLGLVVPRFMLRNPYGENTDPIDSFDFEEFTPQSGLSGMLWGNSAVVAGLLLGATWSQQGSSMKPGSVLSIGEMPFYYYTDADGDQTALPCTERMLSSRMAEGVIKHRFMPMLSIKGEPQIRLGGFKSLAGGNLAGSWQPATASANSAASEPEAGDTETAETSEPAPESTDAPAEPASDPELDKLLASLNEDTAPAETPPEPPPGEEPSADQPIDPDLAALLKDLG